MHGFDRLLACRGTWSGTNHVRVDSNAKADESAATVIVTPVLNDTFVRLDHTWSWDGQPQCGSLLIGFHPTTLAATIHWIDTWHNGRVAMPLVGRFDANGVLVAHGTFPTTDGPDWGWRIEVRVDESRLKLDMFCVRPSGDDDGGAWTELTRVSTPPPASRIQ